MEELYLHLSSNKVRCYFFANTYFLSTLTTFMSVSQFLKCLIMRIAFGTIHAVKNIHMIKNLKFYLTSADQV